MAHYFKQGSFYSGTYGDSWHGQEDFDNPIGKGATVTEAIAANGLGDIEVVFAQNVANVPVNGGIKQVTTGKPSLWMTGVKWTDDGLQTLDRVVDWYQPIQNSEYAKTLDVLTKKYQLGSAFHCGSLGETVIFQFEMPEFYVQGLEEEGHKAFMTIAENRHNGVKWFGTTLVRIVCQNTFNLAVGKGLRNLPNSANSDMMLAFEVALEQHRISQLDALNFLFTVKAEDTDVSAVANALFPMPKRPKVLDKVDNAVAVGYDMSQDDSVTVHVADKAKLAQANLDRAASRRVAHLNEFFTRHRRLNDESPHMAGTKYALWQAATEHMNHTDLWRTPKDGQNYNLLFGEQGKALQAAWAVLTK